MSDRNAALRLILLFEAATFAIAALIHFSVLMEGFEHEKAAIAETVIATVLTIGAVVGWLNAAWTRLAALIAQGFALLGTFVGVFTIAVGVGPQTTPDIVYHAAIIAVLIAGLVFAARTRLTADVDQPPPKALTREEPHKR